MSNTPVNDLSTPSTATGSKANNISVSNTETGDQDNRPLSKAIDFLVVARDSYEPAESDRLGETFHAAGNLLEDIINALKKANDHIPAEIPEEAIPSLDACNITAELLKAVFSNVSSASLQKRRQSYLTFIKKNGRENLVEELVGNMIGHVTAFAENCEVDAEIEDELDALQNANENLAGMEPSIPVRAKKTDRFSNHGSGSQYNVTGKGTQNNVSGKAKQFFKSRFDGNTTIN